nr:DUF5753 domain-containing protein [Nocardia africana]
MVRISTAQFRDLLDFYGADAETKDEVLGRLQEIWSAKGQTSSGWWRAYADVVNPHFDHFMSLEQACSRLTAFTLTLLPGLLQTPAYRRAVVAVNDPDMAVVDVERRLELTARRQRRLTDDPGFSVEVLLSEAALRHQVGGQASMARQLRHLMEIGSLPNVCVRAVPFGVEMHPGVEHLQPGGRRLRRGRLPRRVHRRGTRLQEPNRPNLLFTPTEWDTFTTALDGRFDNPTT